MLRPLSGTGGGEGAGVRGSLFYSYFVWIFFFFCFVFFCFYNGALHVVFMCFACIWLFILHALSIVLLLVLLVLGLAAACDCGTPCPDVSINIFQK